MSDKIDVPELARLLSKARNNIDAIDGTTFGDLRKMLDTIAIDVQRALLIADAMLAARKEDRP